MSIPADMVEEPRHMGSKSTTGITTGVLGAILIAVLLSVGAFAVHRADAVEEKHDTHSKLEGHPRLVERVDAIKEDIEQFREQQEKHTELLEQIDRNTRQ